MLGILKIDAALFMSLCLKCINIRWKKWISGTILTFYSATLFYPLKTGFLYGYGGFTIVAMVAATLVATIASLPPGVFFSNRIIVWIGRRSYGLYVYHLPIFLALEHFRKLDDRWNFVSITLIRFAILFLITAASYRFVEKPFLAMKRKVGESRV